MQLLHFYLGLMVLVHFFTAGMNLNRGERAAAAVNAVLAGVPLGLLLGGIS